MGIELHRTAWHHAVDLSRVWQTELQLPLDTRLGSRAALCLHLQIEAAPDRRLTKNPGPQLLLRRPLHTKRVQCPPRRPIEDLAHMRSLRFDHFLARVVKRTGRGERDLPNLHRIRRPDRIGNVVLDGEQGSALSDCRCGMVYLDPDRKRASLTDAPDTSERPKRGFRRALFSMMHIRYIRLT